MKEKQKAIAETIETFHTLSREQAENAILETNIKMNNCKEILEKMEEYINDLKDEEKTELNKKLLNYKTEYYEILNKFKEIQDNYINKKTENALMNEELIDEEVIITKEKTQLYIIDGESFRDIQKRNNEMILKERYNFLNNIFLFECLDKISKYNVAQKMEKKEFPPATKIITEGEKGDTLYIIKEGIVSCRIGPKEIRRLSNNEYFGQNSILIDVKRGADIITLQKTVCYELSKYDLKEALTKDYIDVILFCFFKNAIEKDNNLKNIIIESHIHGVFNCFSIQQYARNERIYDPKSNKEINIEKNEMKKKDMKEEDAKEENKDIYEKNTEIFELLKYLKSKKKK